MSSFIGEKAGHTGGCVCLPTAPDDQIIPAQAVDRILSSPRCPKGHRMKQSGLPAGMKSDSTRDAPLRHTVLPCDLDGMGSCSYGKTDSNDESRSRHTLVAEINPSPRYPKEYRLKRSGFPAGMKADSTRDAPLCHAVLPYVLVGSLDAEWQNGSQRRTQDVVRSPLSRARPSRCHPRKTKKHPCGCSSIVDEGTRTVRSPLPRARPSRCHPHKTKSTLADASCSG